MRRPNLARERFENGRPVWVLGGVLAGLAAILSVTTLVEVLGVRGVEQAQLKRVEQLQAQRLKLQQVVATSNRQLASVGWKKLQSEVDDAAGRRGAPPALLEPHARRSGDEWCPGTSGS